MNFETNPQHDLPHDGTPSDEDLLSYLLGEAGSASRQRLENWLSANPQHGERLAELASLVLMTSEATTDWTLPKTTQRLWETPTRSPLRLRRIAALFALAASV